MADQCLQPLLERERRSSMADGVNSTASEDSPIPMMDTTDKLPIISGYGATDSPFKIRRRDVPDRNVTSSLSLSQYLEKGRTVSPTIRTLGYWGGVFGPVALAQFSTNVFQRVGFVVGQSGLLITLVQFILAYFILAMTILSICAVSTNGAIEGGGAYYMISRALGPEFGGSIGFLFFLANIFSAALYIAGFTEGIVSNFGPSGNLIHNGLPGETKWWVYLYSSVAALFCLAVCLIGGAMFARTSLLILFVVVVCCLSVIVSMFAHGAECITIPSTNKIAYPNLNGSALDPNHTLCGNYTGLSLHTIQENLYANYTIDYSTEHAMSFATVFAILFSSVTGIMNGANMSGELKDPSKAIPRGTMAAAGFTFSVYTCLCLLTSATSSRYLLVNDYAYMQPTNLWPPFVVIGIFAATLSAALGNLIGASRILEALAKDELFWILLKPATITTKSGNPYVAVIMAWILVQLVMLIGSLNAIAPLVSVFFLLSYAATNLACFALSISSAPNFRPTFRYFSWHTCLLGLIGCIVMCFLINAIFAALAIITCMLLIIALHFRALNTSWGSISQALIFHQVRKYLLLLDSRKDHVKYWRPQMLLMLSNPRSAAPLILFVNDIKKSGLYVLGHVYVGDFDRSPTDPGLDDHTLWQELVDYLRVKAFIETTVSNSLRSGVHHLIRLAGLGGMKPNTICFGFYDDAAPEDLLLRNRPRKKAIFLGNGNSADQAASPAKRIRPDAFPVRSSGIEKHLSVEEYVQMITDCLKLQKNVCLFRHFQNLDRQAIVHGKGTRYVDAWPINFFRPESVTYFDTTCLFLLQLACVLHMVPGWKSKTILRVYLCVDAREDDVLSIERKLDQLLQQLRIIAEVRIITWEHVTCLLDNVDDKTESDSNPDFELLPVEYVNRMNELIRVHSNNTAVTFCYLPAPPQSKSRYAEYIRQVDLLTQDLAPTVLVHGLHPVTSTTL